MRKISAILLIGVFAFNLFGYRMVFDVMAVHSDVVLEKALDEDRYEDHELISIKQPLQLPYYTNSEIFDRISGEVEIDGSTYRYVKYRIYKDSIEMLCIPHAQKTKLNHALDVYAGNVSDATPGDNGRQIPHGKSFFSSLSEFEEHIPFQFHHPFFQTANACSQRKADRYLRGFFSKTGQPPEFHKA